jgi:hypothetical protein
MEVEDSILRFDVGYQELSHFFKPGACVKRHQRQPEAVVCKQHIPIFPPDFVVLAAREQWGTENS